MVFGTDIPPFKTEQIFPSYSCTVLYSSQILPHMLPIKFSEINEAYLLTFTFAVMKCSRESDLRYLRAHTSRLQFFVVAGS